jgi:hypothetical protein
MCYIQFVQKDSLHTVTANRNTAARCYFLRLKSTILLHHSTCEPPCDQLQRKGAFLCHLCISNHSPLVHWIQATTSATLVAPRVVASECTSNFRTAVQRATRLSTNTNTYKRNHLPSGERNGKPVGLYLSFTHPRIVM